jgi:membrane glycosyltransferase
MTVDDSASPDLRGAAGRRGVEIPAARWRRVLFFLLVGANAGAGIAMMFEILRANGTTALEWAILALFAVTYTWITIAVWTALAGFVLQLLRLDPLSLRRRRPPDERPITARTAIVMPVYNEDPERVLKGLESTWRSVMATDAAARFDCYLLSDSTDDATAAAEWHGWQALRAHVPGGERIHYRRRADNIGRKPGNLAEFCRRWGGHYDHMVVLDADSVMTGEAITALVRAMQANPAAGLIQTVPLPSRQVTFFGRFTQFAARLLSPMLAHGFSFWQTDSANYWGHNAIVRVRAFTETCGLPTLKGKPPMGGEILSHDFVEAALLRRGGWHVYLLPEIDGSYEEVPSNILDFANRDRRWAQGNLQHLRLLGAYGLHPINRLHFVMGATAFLSSLLWLLMLILSTADAMTMALTEHQFFGAGKQLFPDWPVVRTFEILTLLGVTAGMLLLPKILGIGLALARPGTRRAFGGGVRLVTGALVEIAFSILIAPIMMTYHAWFVLNVFAGRTARWAPQPRSGRAVPWREAFARTGVGVALALAWGGATYWVAPTFFWWLTPILTGLVLAPAVVVVSSDLRVGRAFQRIGLLRTPEETEPPPALAAIDEPVSDHRLAPLLPAAADEAWCELPPELPRAMPIQTFTGGDHWRHSA